MAILLHSSHGRTLSMYIQIRRGRGSLVFLLLECFTTGDEFVSIRFFKLPCTSCLIDYSSANETAFDEMSLRVVCV